MPSLTRDAILGAADLKTETVKVPEWGGEVLVATMTGESRDAWEMSLSGGKPGAPPDLKNVRARLLAYCLVNEKGERVFTDDDIAKLGRKSAAALARCAAVAQRLNSLREQDLKDAVGN